MPHRINPKSDGHINQPKKSAAPSRALITLSETTASTAKKPLDNAKNLTADWKKPKVDITKRYSGKNAKKTDRVMRSVLSAARAK